MSSAKTPLELGYRMPAEWEPHRATWLTWPRPDGISFPGRYAPVPDVYGQFVFHLTQCEEVHINVWNDDLAAAIRDVLRRHHVDLDRVHLHPFRAYEPWCRDHGPIFLVREGQGFRDRAVVDWGYNAWGNKYPPFDLDDQVPTHVAKLRGLPLFEPGIVMEGGSLEVNGRGTVLTTEACLLNPNRNPHLNKVQIEGYLRDFLGVRHILWLGDGIEGDDTDGHVDDLARFIANFYIANDRVIVPTFRDRNDAMALERLQRGFPDRRVVGIDSSDLIWGLGSFHCISQQEPA